jgi:hypothetical protein
MKTSSCQAWAVGDPAQIVDVPANTTDGNGNLITGAKATKVLFPDDPSNVHHSYINDHVKMRVGPCWSERAPHSPLARAPVVEYSRQRQLQLPR